MPHFGTIDSMLNDAAAFADVETDVVRRRGLTANSDLVGKWERMGLYSDESVGEFYSDAHEYFYDLVHWHINEPGRRVWTERIVELALAQECGTALDMGCGIAAEAIALADNRVNVVLADYPNRAFEFAKWRLERLQLMGRARVYDLSAPIKWGNIPACDMGIAIDVLEHVLPDDRVHWMQEFARRSRRWIAISAPFQDGHDFEHPMHFYREGFDLDVFLRNAGFEPFTGLFYARVRGVQ